MISTPRKRLVQIFLLVQLLDLLTTLIGIEYFGFRELNPSFSNISLLHLSFNKLVVVYVMTKMLFYDSIPLWFIKAFSIFAFIPVFTNSIQLVLEVL